MAYNKIHWTIQNCMTGYNGRSYYRFFYRGHLVNDMLPVFDTRMAAIKYKHENPGTMEKVGLFYEKAISHEKQKG